MGRRAKNKQAAPQPLREKSDVNEKKHKSSLGKANGTLRKAGKPLPQKMPAGKPKAAATGKKTTPKRIAEEDPELDEEEAFHLAHEREEDEEAMDLPDDEYDEDDSAEDVFEHKEIEDDVQEAPTEDPMAELLASLGLPRDGKKLTERQKKKVLAEAERLEELLKSSGHQVKNNGDGDEEEIEEDEDEDEDEYEDDGAEDLEDEDGALSLNEYDEEASDADDGEISADEQSGFLLPTLEEEEEEERAPLDLQLIQMRIREVVGILGDMARLGEPGRSRADYLDRLTKDVQKYYGYNEYLATMFLELFPPDEAIEFFEANEVPRPVTIRVNTLRTHRRDLAQKLINKGVSLEPVGPWSKVGLQIFESPVPIGATPEYLVGDYMLQAVSSFLPCVSLAPQPNERILDMASAPGGKVTYLSALMQNTGCIFANDSSKARIKSLTANISRMGCRNIVVCNYDGRQFPKVIGGFDRVMLDSPCSGTGVISKDPSVKSSKSKRDFILLTQLQKQLILCAIDSVNPRSETGGYVVYSTCSVMVDENEDVIEYALHKRPNVRIVPTGIDFGRDGFKSFRGRKFSEKMNLSRRVFPHAHNLDGFFVCKLKVEPINKSAARREEAQDTVQEAHARNSSASLFDAEEDEAIIQRARERGIKKRKL